MFTSERAAALVLSNRYDGIDLPDDDCRLVVMDLEKAPAIMAEQQQQRERAVESGDA